MRAKTVKRPWTEEETRQLIQYWRIHKVLGKSDSAITRLLVTKLGRSYGSILNKAVQQKLTTKSSRLAAEYL